MFMPARELHQDDRVHFSEVEQANPSTQEDVDIRGETEEELWERKAEESDERGLTKSIRAKGMKRPVTLWADSTHYGPMRTAGQIMDGYHRVAAAHDIDPDTEVPVEHKDSRYRHKFDSPFYLTGREVHE
jgi:hypothetical protein